jgi:hypothetical protein
MRPLGPLAKDIVGAVLLAFGTIFQPKARPDDHWSQRPGVEVVEDAAVEGTGAPPDGPRRRRRLPAIA